MRRYSTLLLCRRMVNRAGRAAARRARAVRSPLPEAAWGCLGLYAAVLLILSALAWLAGWTALRVFAGVLAALGLVGMLFGAVSWGKRVALLAAIRNEWTQEGVKCLVVFSNSPRWHTHITEQWLPRLGGTARLLNWTERSGWDERDLAVRVFRSFVVASHNYNPAIVVFRGLRHPLVYRFYYAFQEAKHGEDVYVQAIERDCFEALERAAG